MEVVMKKFVLITVCTVAVLFIVNVGTAQTLKLTIANQLAVGGTNFTFDINMEAVGDSIFLSGGDLVLTFNSANFTGPATVINDGSGDGTTFPNLRNSWGTPGTQTTALGASVPASEEAVVNTAAISSNEIILNLQQPSFTNQTQFRKNVVRLVPGNVYQFGHYVISGITNTGGTMGLAWKPSGGTFTQVSGYAKVSPWVSSALTLDLTGAIVNAPLPVELTSFTASANRLNTQLAWSTATEVDNYGFDIERRSVETAGAAWAKVGFVQGAGTSNSPRHYTFADNASTSGRYAYRLKQIDTKGGFKYSQTAEVEVGLVAKVLTLSGNYPNPFNPTTNIEFTVATDGKAVLRVYNTLGQQVAELYNGEAQAGRIIQTHFDASRLASGVYFSRLQVDGKNLVKRMMLVK